jgi:riboflavin kinase/FMN adenylyltransferase
VHLFDFNQGLYGQCIEVIIKKKLRPVIKFDSLEALTTQIKVDSEQAKQALA